METKTTEELRKKFEAEMDTPVINDDGEPDIDYVRWLEDKVLASQFAPLSKEAIVERTRTAICHNCNGTGVFYSTLNTAGNTSAVCPICSGSGKETIIEKISELSTPKETGDTFNKNDIDLAYLTGCFNVVGIDGLAKEIERLKSLGLNPHDIFKVRESQPQSAVQDKAIIVKQKYVVGFMFTNDCKKVILIRKKKPTWQAGKLNGVGGKIEINETPLNAMIREYKEEAGIKFDNWDNFLTVEYKSCIVYFYKAFDDGCFYQSETKELEIIEKIEIGHWPFNEVIPNLNWIVNLALDPDIQYSNAVEQLASLQSNPVLTDTQIEKCDHPKETRELYHDGATICKKCNCIIAQGGKWFGDNPQKLSML